MKLFLREKDWVRVIKKKKLKERKKGREIPAKG
jgi:hypothetical protein